MFFVVQQKTIISGINFIYYNIWNQFQNMIWFCKSFIKFCKSCINLIKLVSSQTCSLARVRRLRPTVWPIEDLFN